MKSEEILRRYSNGERDFRGCKIQGENFRGKNLSEADFSYADIRGSNFVHAILQGAKFTGAKAGLQKRWIALQLTIFTLLAVFSGTLLGYCAFLWFDLYSTNSFSMISPILSLGICGGTLIITIITVFNQGFTEEAFKTISITAAIIVSVTSVLIGSRFISYAGFNYDSIIPVVISTCVVVSTIAISSTSVIAIFSTNKLSAVVIVILGTLVGAVFTIIGNALGYFGAAAVLLTTFDLRKALAETADSPEHLEAINKSAQAPDFVSSFIYNISIPIAVSLVIFILSIYVAWKALIGNKKYSLIRNISIAFSSVGATSFLLADLVDADFREAILRNTDLRRANLTRTLWMESRYLDRARVGSTYLVHPKIRQLVTTGSGQDQNFDGLNLGGINLQGSNLQDASFIGTSLNYANLLDADLSRARLKQTQLNGAILTRAVLTGAYIEDWGITGTTNLSSVHCDYVFMRVPTKENPNPLRKPDNLLEMFNSGEFCDFIQPYIDILDLYHSQDVDPRAVSIAFGKLSQRHPEANLEIVAIEKRGKNSLNLKVQVKPTVSKSELSAEYFSDYNQIKALPIQVRLLVEKDARIRSLENMIDTALKQPTFNIQGDMAVTETKGININSGGNIGDVSGLVGGDVSGVINLGVVSGNVENAINQLPDEVDSAQPNLKELLTQLHHLIENSSEVSNADKTDLLEQVQALAEVKQTDESTKKENLVRKARKMFEATLKGLPDTAKIVEACNKLMPIILKALGVSL